MTASMEHLPGCYESPTWKSEQAARCEVKRLFEIGAFLDEFVICPTQAEGIGKLRQRVISPE